MQYQHNRDHHPKVNTSVSDGLSTLLVSKLHGKTTAKPQKPIPYNLWAKVSTVEIEAEILVRHKKEPPSQSPCGEDKKKKACGVSLCLHSIVNRELFAELPKAVQSVWKDEVDIIHLEAVAEWEATTSHEPSAAPAD